MDVVDCVAGDGDISPVQPALYSDINRAWGIMDINLMMNNIEVSIRMKKYVKIFQQIYQMIIHLKNNNL